MHERHCNATHSLKRIVFVDILHVLRPELHVNAHARAVSARRCAAHFPRAQPYNALARTAMMRCSTAETAPARLGSSARGNCCRMRMHLICAKTSVASASQQHAMRSTLAQTRCDSAVPASTETAASSTGSREARLACEPAGPAGAQPWPDSRGSCASERWSVTRDKPRRRARKTWCCQPPQVLEETTARW